MFQDLLQNTFCREDTAWLNTDSLEGLGSVDCDITDNDTMDRAASGRLKRSRKGIGARKKLLFRR